MKIKQMGKDIFQAIIDHQEIYILADKKVPIYKLTYKEHELLIEYITALLNFSCKPYEFINQLCGVDILVVTPIIF